MFEAAGIDALTGLALIYAAILLGSISGLIHLFWQLATGTTRIGWRSLITSSTAVAGSIGLAMIVGNRGGTLPETGIVVLLAASAVFAGALIGRSAGVVIRRIANKSAERGYH